MVLVPAANSSPGTMAFQGRETGHSLRKTIEQLKHTSGTSMSDHIDLFEKICGQIASSGLPATEEEKLDWFLESVHEDTYHAIKAHCNSLKILGTLSNLPKW